MKQLFRTCDFIFQVLPGSPFWTSDMHKPFLIGILFPFIRCNPWQLRGCPKCTQWEGNCEVCQKARKWSEGIFCANFGRNVMGFETCRRTWCGRCYLSNGTLEFHVADLTNSNGEADDEDRVRSGWKPRKGDRTQFHTARDGDDLMVAFECNTCVFSKLYKRFPKRMMIQET